MDVSNEIGWLDAKNILLTGATGYLGKVICEKLLRECLGIRRLYILLRANEKEDLQERIVKFKNDAVFERVKSIDQKIMDKVVPIEGDLSKADLGLLHFDINFLRMEINVIIHAGSNSDFYVSLKDAILTNVRGTRYLLQLAEAMTRLESFVYVSHIFSNCYERIIEEKIFKPQYEPNDLIKMQEENKECFMESQIIKDFSSFYLFSHHLAETLVGRSTIPTSIVRLPTLTPSLVEPFPGWIDTSNHLDNLMILAQNGSVQSMYGKQDTPIDILPVDLAANGIITITQKREKFQGPDTGCFVFNLTDGGTGEISWGNLLKSNRKSAIENPLETTYWSPGATIYSNYYLYVATFVLYQIIPAILYDVLSFLCTGRIHFVRTQLDVFRQLKTVERFFHKTWMFDTENTDELINTMSSTEKTQFEFRTQDFNLEDYMRTWNHGRREYLLQLNQKASRVAKWKLQAFGVMGVILKTVFFIYFGNEILKIMGCEQYLGVGSNGSALTRLFSSTFQKV